MSLVRPPVLRSAADRRDRGSIAVELVTIAPLLIALLLFVVGLGRIAHARGQVDGAAADAVRSASLARTPDAARQVGEAAAAAYLGDGACKRMDVDIDTSRWRPGGAVGARVRCVASLAGLGLAGFPGSRTLTASAEAPLDVYRGEAGGFTNSEAVVGANRRGGARP